jgi:mannobiose 2-epimerase
MGVAPEELAAFGRRVDAEWRDNIAPFWATHGPDERYGGFRGWISNDLRVDEEADKGVILNARILWTFSRAFRATGDRDHRALAERAYEYLTGHFIDRELGGVYWTVDHRGRPADTKKRSYAQAFALYALAEFSSATGDREALAHAVDVFEMLEARCRDRVHDGYFETFERDWSLAADQRLSEVDRDDKKSMNAHLHVLEAYATLARASGEPRVRERLRALIEIVLGRVLDESATRQRMFFDEAWAPQSEVVSLGHDVEASWLLYEAAEALGDEAVLGRARAASLSLAGSVLDAGLDAEGGLFYEALDGRIVDDEKHWWAQAEAVVGFVNAWQLGGDERFLEAALRVWAFVDRHLVDREHGEWFWKSSRRGAPSPDMPKVSQWKCPYHNGRMCFEVVRRLAGGDRA